MAKQSSPLAPREELSVWQAEWLTTYGTASVSESFWLISTERDGYFAVASFEAPKVFKHGLPKR